MLAASLLLILDLPPLAFGPAMPPAFAPPPELTCPVAELGRPLRLAPAAPPRLRPGLDPRTLRPAPARHLVNPLADGLLLLATAYGTRAAWDDRTWSTKAWAAAGAVTPVLIPPQAPPAWAAGQ